MLRAAALAVSLGASLLHGQSGGAAEGVVTNSITHAPIAGVAVTLWTPQAVNYNATTDQSGAWRITDIKPGRYRSRFEKEGFVEPRRGGPGVDPMIAVGPGGNPVRLNAELIPLATLRGRVVDSDRNPAPGAEVSLVSAAGYGAYAPVKTDADGQFSISEIEPGSYQLLARFQSPDPKPADQERVDFIPTYYPSAIDLSQAGAIDVGGGNDLFGLDIRLRTATVYRLRGIVLDESGSPVPKAHIRLMATSPEKRMGGQMSFGTTRYFLGMASYQSEEALTDSDAEGQFEFRSVRSGEWVLRADTEPKRGADREFVLQRSGNVPVTISDRDLDGVRIQFPQTFTLEAQVDYGDRPLPDAVRNFPVPVILYSLDEGGSGLPRMPNRTGGALRFANVTPGRYKIVPLSGLPPGYYAASVRLAGQEVLGQPVNLNAGTPPLQITYKPNAGTVRGIIERGEGAIVLLWPQSGSALDIVRAVQAGPGGTFEIGSLPPGAYYMVALDTPNPDKLSETVLRGLVSSATSVSVDEGASPSVSVPLTHVP